MKQSAIPVLTMLLLVNLQIYAQDTQFELLWPKIAPGAVGTEEADRPKLWLHLLPKSDAPRPAVIVCPGGGYGGVMMSYEGHDVARWLNSAGVVGFVLQYRIAPRYRHPAPLSDAHRAIRLVRARAAEWGVDPAKVGILGFSAGGHLTATAATIFDDGDPKAEDPVERQGCRPDFAVPVYPVISFVEPCMHTGSRDNLLGKNPDPKLMEELSPERRVTAKTPPAFIVHGSDDQGVPVENSILFYKALQKAGVPAELHLFAHGPHGFGLGVRKGVNRGDPVSMWPALCVEWMKGQGILGAEAGDSPPRHQDARDTK